MEELIASMLEAGVSEAVVNEILDKVERISEAEIPQFMQDEQRKKNNDKYIADVKNKIAKENKEAQNKKEYMANSWGHLRKTVRGEKSVAPVLKESTVNEIMSMVEEIIAESSHKRKYGKGMNAETPIEAGGTKYYKDAITMNPDGHTKSNGHNGVNIIPWTTYDSFHDKRVLQDNIKAGKNRISDTKEFKKIQRDLFDLGTQNDMYGNSLKQVANKLANRGSSAGRSHRKNKYSIDDYGKRNGANDNELNSKDEKVAKRVEATKKRIKGN